MAVSRRQEIVEALRTRLQAIHIAGGFQTDAGDTVLLGEVPTLGPDDPDTALAMVMGDESVKQQGKSLTYLFPVGIQALAKTTSDEPWVAIEQMLADIIAAIELDDALIVGSIKFAIAAPTTRTLERESGSDTVGAMVIYPVTYSRSWGQA